MLSQWQINVREYEEIEATLNHEVNKYSRLPTLTAYLNNQDQSRAPPDPIKIEVGTQIIVKENASFISFNACIIPDASLSHYRQSVLSSKFSAEIIGYLHYIDFPNRLYRIANAIEESFIWGTKKHGKRNLKLINHYSKGFCHLQKHSPFKPKGIWEYLPNHNFFDLKNNAAMELEKTHIINGPIHLLVESFMEQLKWKYMSYEIYFPNFIERLPKQEQQILKMRYGLDGNSSVSLIEAADVMNLSKGRAGVIEERAIQRIMAIMKHDLKGKLAITLEEILS